MSDSKQINPEKAIGFKTKEVQSAITARDAIIYALGVGYSQDPLKEADLPFTYELHENFKVFPTYGTCIHNTDLFEGLTSCPGMPNFNPMMLLHGEQRIEIHKPLTPGAKLVSVGKVADVADKGKGTVVTFEISSYEVDEHNKRTLAFVNQISLFIRGISANGYKGKSTNQIPQKPSRNPDAIVDEKTVPNQAIVYRLSGDYNPLHIDANMAAMGGFDRPILHGLCFYGIAAKVVCQTFCGGDPHLIKSVQARFTSHVFPGDTLKFSLWKDENRVIFSGSTAERQKECIVGVVELNQQPKAKL